MSGPNTAADCPNVYDCVIDGYGYVTARAVDPNMPFRIQQANFSYTPTFVERQNVSNSYGDNAQDFFLTIRQRDWSLGEQQKFFRAGQDGRYWMGSGVDITTPGQVSLSPSFSALAFPGTAALTTVRNHTNSDPTQNIALSATNLYTIDSTGAIVDKGAHGLGAAPARWGSANDNNGTLMSTTTAGTVGVRYWNGAAFSTFSATGADSLAYLNNSVYGFSFSGFKLMRYDTSGTPNTLFTWQAAGGGAGGFSIPKLVPFGGKLLIGSIYAQESSELWIYDGVGTFRLEVFPENFYINDIDVLYGVAYISGSFIKKSGGSVFGRPAVLYFDGSQIGKVWQANDFNTVALTSAALGPHPALGINGERLVFTDETTGNLTAYDPTRGSISSIGSFTPNTGDSCQMASSPYFVAHVRNSTTGYYFPSGIPSTGYVVSSLIDFDSSLAKIFRGVTVEFDSASDGNGGSVDIAYQLNGVAGGWTALASGVTSGVETTFPANTTGHSITVKITLNKGTSTKGPVVKSMNVRGAPVQTSYRLNEYVLDLTGKTNNTGSFFVRRRDNSDHNLTGEEMRANLTASIQSAVPLTITDRTGTYTGVLEPGSCEFDQVRPGQYYARVRVREV